MSKRIVVPIVAAIVLAILVTGVVAAQGAASQAQGVAPAATARPNAPAPRRVAPKARPQAVLPGFGTPQGGWKAFDAVAGALKLTPTQLFEQLHNGRTVAQIAQAQGVSVQVVQEAARQSGLDMAHQAIDKALAAGKITQKQADWLTQGVDNGWFRGAFTAVLRAWLKR